MRLRRASQAGSSLRGSGLSERTGEREPLHVGFAGDREAAIAGHASRELAWLRDRNGTLLSIEWSERLRRNEDLTVRAWIAKRFRDDERDAIWHLRGLADLAAYLAPKTR